MVRMLSTSSSLHSPYARIELEMYISHGFTINVPYLALTRSEVGDREGGREGV